MIMKKTNSKTPYSIRNLWSVLIVYALALGSLHFKICDWCETRLVTVTPDDILQLLHVAVTARYYNFPDNDVNQSCLG